LFLQCYLRAAELEMRAAQEPLRSDRDVKGIKAQILRRIVKLEERERKRQELLTELIPEMGARGHDTGAVKAVLDGWPDPSRAPGRAGQTASRAW
jgi:hypothetical protein